MQEVQTDYSQSQAAQQFDLPYSQAARAKILGVTFDQEFSFGRHFEGIMSKVEIRLALLAKLPSYSWGLETGVWRMTGKALVISVPKYCLAVYGSGLPEHLSQKLDTSVINILARRILGVGPSARLPVLYAVADVTSIHNVYAQHCGGLLNLALRASAASSGLVCMTGSAESTT